MSSSDTSPVAGLRQKSHSISKNFLFLCLALALTIGFVAGTRSEDILRLIGPALGMKVETGQLDLNSVQNTYRKLKAHYDGELNDQALIDGASRGLVAAAGDDYTMFFDAKEAEEFEKDISGEIGGGIGVELGKRNEQPTVVRVLEENPAARAGLQAGDVIVKVNGESSGDWTVDQVANKIRGAIGTTVRLDVLRNDEVKEFTITRAEVKNPSVQASVNNGVGTLKLTRFDDDTARLARKAAENFKRQNVKAVILDLRGNGGGYLTSAQEVAGIWLNNKVVVSEKSQGKVVDELSTGHDAVLAGVKTIVLVNSGSASASEILAGALQDHRAATLVGETTFGKGTVQQVLDLGAGTKLKVTVARWYTPKGRNITKEGIAPNHKVELSAQDANAGRDPQMDVAKRLAG